MNSVSPKLPTIGEATLHRLRPWWLVVLVLLIHSSASFAATLTSFNNFVGPRTDECMGIAGFVIEDFEDTTLTPGLKVQSQSPSLGGYGPASVLPFTFDDSQDLVTGIGGFWGANQMWDVTHGLVNRLFLAITGYANDGGWSDVFLLFEGDVGSPGFSYTQAEALISISLDLGSGFTSFGSSPVALASGSRNGYLRIDAGPGETIYGIKLDNQADNHDGILYDHLAFQPVPRSPIPDAGGTAAMLLLRQSGIAALSSCGQK